MTPLGEAAKTAITFKARTRRLTQSRNLARQLPAVAECMPGLALNATPLGEAAKTAITFMARARRLIQD